MNEPCLILADEPTRNVDSWAGTEIVALLRCLNEEWGVTVVLATHNAAIAREADRLVWLKEGMEGWCERPQARLGEAQQKAEAYLDCLRQRPDPEDWETADACLQEVDAP